MKREETNPDKELYRQLRGLDCEQLWEDEVARFDQAAPRERSERVALVRAVGVVFSEKGGEEQRARARPWLRGLLGDADEKIRRYAMAALPKIGCGPEEEADLLALFRTTGLERERKFLAQTLQKIGGAASLKELGEIAGGSLPQTEMKIRASVARSQSPSGIRMDRTLSDFEGLRIHLRGRRGLEGIVRDEVEEHLQRRGKFKIAEVRAGLVAITPTAPFKLADLYALRCFGFLGFDLGSVTIQDEAKRIDSLAALITSPRSRRIFEALTEGSIRYRLDFVGQGHQRGAVRRLANRAYALCPGILNDARVAPWEVAIQSSGRGASAELRPQLTPDPRFSYRREDVPAASHPPLAACMARLGGRLENEVVWDPFCGSGLELIERALLGGVAALYGTDRSAGALAISRDNFDAAKLKTAPPTLACCDFRDFASVPGLGPNTASLIITNPPMGKRVPVPSLRALIEDLLFVAAKVLRPGGRLVFANPLHIDSPNRLLKLQSRQTVDFGGFDCRLEKYVKLASY